MIKRIFEKNNALENFLLSHRENSVMISALIDTYGLTKDVYSLWVQEIDGEPVCVMGIYGDGMCVCISEKTDNGELKEFITFSDVSSVTLTKDNEAFLELDGFNKAVSDFLVMKRKEELPIPSDVSFLNYSPSLSNVHTLMKKYLSVSDRDTFVCDMQTRLNHGTGKAVTAQTDGKTAATACIFFESDTCGFLGGIATDEEYRGRGYASVLVSVLCNGLIKKNKIPMLSCVNPAAKRLYKSLGFEETGKRITYVKERL